jgi:serine/threonine-protein kinase HipA
MVFNVLANNTDDHIKNSSFVMDENGCWRLSPAYDLTFVFDNGGFLPQLSRCLMIRGKLQDISVDDIFNFANDNGISNAESIVRDVVSAVSSFRQLALANNVKAEWIGRVEACLSANLRAMAISLQSAATNDANSADFVEANIDGHSVSHIYLEQAYQGNYHLHAIIDDRQRRFVIRPKTNSYKIISEYGINNVPKGDLIRMLEIFII